MAGELVPVPTDGDSAKPQFIKSRRLSRLTLGEIAFVHRIVIDRDNLTDAYLNSIAVSNKTDRVTAGSAAAKVIKRPHVRAFMREVEESAKAAIRATVNRIVEGIEAIAMADRTEAFNDAGEIKPFSEWPRQLRMALDGVKVKEFFGKKGGKRVVIRREIEIKPGGAKLRALELLAQMRKMIGTNAEGGGDGADASIRVFLQPSPPAPVPGEDDDPPIDDLDSEDDDGRP